MPSQGGWLWRRLPGARPRKSSRPENGQYKCFVTAFPIYVHLLLRQQKVTMSLRDDLFDEVLELEEQFFEEGYELGFADGEDAGRLEGRLFGLEKGFEKHLAMGEMHGRAILWANRSLSGKREKAQIFQESSIQGNAQLHGQESFKPSTSLVQPDIETLPEHSRLYGHVQTLLSLTEPSSFCTKNDDDSVSSFDDRLKRAEGKVKVIERIIGQENLGNAATDFAQKSALRVNNSIEEFSELRSSR